MDTDSKSCRSISSGHIAAAAEDVSSECLRFLRISAITAARIAAVALRGFGVLPAATFGGGNEDSTYYCDSRCVFLRFPDRQHLLRHWLTATTAALQHRERGGGRPSCRLQLAARLVCLRPGKRSVERSIRHNVRGHGGAADDGDDAGRCRLVWHLSRPPRCHDRSRAALRDRRACLRRYKHDQRHEYASVVAQLANIRDAGRLGRRRGHRVYGHSPISRSILPFNMSTSVRRAFRARRREAVARSTQAVTTRAQFRGRHGRLQLALSLPTKRLIPRGKASMAALTLVAVGVTRPAEVTLLQTPRRLRRIPV